MVVFFIAQKTGKQIVITVSFKVFSFNLVLKVKVAYYITVYASMGGIIVTFNALDHDHYVGYNISTLHS